MRGTLVIHAEAACANGRTDAGLRLDEVIECSGDFVAGDDVHVVVRDRTGDQHVRAHGIVRFNAADWRLARTGASPASASGLAIHPEDLVLRWPSA